MEILEEESSQVVSSVGRGDLVVSWLMFYVTLIQPINNTPQNSYQGRTAESFNINNSQAKKMAGKLSSGGMTSWSSGWNGG